jgi:hypothetical protein
MVVLVLVALCDIGWRAARNRIIGSAGAGAVALRAQLRAATNVGLTAGGDLAALALAGDHTRPAVLVNAGSSWWPPGSAADSPTRAGWPPGEGVA